MKNLMYWYVHALKKYAVFTGRASRAEFWWFVLAYVITAIIIGIIFGIIGKVLGAASIGTIVVYLYYLAVMLPYIGVGIRRMHDTGRKGWWILVPLYNLYLWSLKSEAGENKYGPEPKSEIV